MAARYCGCAKECVGYTGGYTGGSSVEPVRGVRVPVLVAWIVLVSSIDIVAVAHPAFAAAASNTATVTTASSGSSKMIAVAGDIACATTDANYNGGNGTATACRQKATSNLLVGGGYAAVLALGDNQYDSGALTEFQRRLRPDLGTRASRSRTRWPATTSTAPSKRVRATSTTSARAGGRREQGLLQLRRRRLAPDRAQLELHDRRSLPRGLRPGDAGCAADLAAHSNVCTLAYWHHPRFSSGTTATTRSCSRSGRTSTTPAPTSC